MCNSNPYYQLIQWLGRGSVCLPHLWQNAMLQQHLCDGMVLQLLLGSAWPITVVELMSSNLKHYIYNIYNYIVFICIYTYMIIYVNCHIWTTMFEESTSHHFSIFWVIVAYGCYSVMDLLELQAKISPADLFVVAATPWNVFELRWARNVWCKVLTRSWIACCWNPPKSPSLNKVHLEQNLVVSSCACQGTSSSMVWLGWSKSVIILRSFGDFWWLEGALWLPWNLKDPRNGEIMPNYPELSTYGHYPWWLCWIRTWTWIEHFFLFRNGCWSELAAQKLEWCTMICCKTLINTCRFIQFNHPL